MKAVAIVANMSKSQIHQIAQRITQWCRIRGISVWCQQELGCGDYPLTLGDPLPPVDMVMVLGGDGTFLSVARRFAAANIPLLGVNLGRLGFLTEVEPGDDLEAALAKLAAGEYIIDSRSMLDIRIVRKGQEVEQTYALNEVTVAKGPLARIIRLDAQVDGALVGSYHGDGLIVSTPTGSTGYSLSAGGPIIAPNVKVMIMTPICPHTLFARPIVVDRHARITVDIRSPQQEIVLTVDGQHSLYLQYNDTIEVSHSAHRTSLVRLQGKSFFDILHRKLMDQTRKG